MRKIQVELSVDGIQKATREFRSYIATLDSKCERFVERLIADVGLRVVETNMNSFKGDSDHNYSTYFELHRQPNEHSAWGKLVVQNKDILFIEFGAGIHYNNGNAHPQAREFGYGVGTYPGQKNAINPGYWWYKDDGGDLHFSMGTEATMPMYRAYTEMINQVGTIAREVFGNG